MQVGNAQEASVLKAGEALTAKVLLKDGRTLETPVSIEAARPSAILITKSARTAGTGRDGEIRLASADELPHDAQLTFSLRAKSPVAFAYDEKIEVATLDGSSSTVLGVGAGEPACRMPWWPWRRLIRPGLRPFGIRPAALPAGERRGRR
jgi:hypothetical protein